MFPFTSFLKICKPPFELYDPPLKEKERERSEKKERRDKELKKDRREEGEVKKERREEAEIKKESHDSGVVIKKERHDADTEIVIKKERPSSSGHKEDQPASLEQPPKKEHRHHKSSKSSHHRDKHCDSSASNKLKTKEVRVKAEPPSAVDNDDESMDVNGGGREETTLSWPPRIKVIVFRYR